MTRAPIALFVYNRFDHTTLTLDALARNNLAISTDLYIFSDAPKTDAHRSEVERVRELSRAIKGFHNLEVIEREINFGLAQNIITGTSLLLERYKRCIVVEDDLVTSPHFLTYMNTALDYYQDQPAVFSVSGYNYPPRLLRFPKDYEYDVYCSLRNSSWGWGTWENRWRKADWEVKDYDAFMASPSRRRAFAEGGEDLVRMLSLWKTGRIDSWAIRWTYAHFTHHAVSICPVRSYVHNIGHDSSGVHSRRSNRFGTDVLRATVEVKMPERVFCDPQIIAAFKKVHRRSFLYKAARALYLAMRRGRLT